MISRDEALEIYASIRDEEPFCHYAQETLMQILQRNPVFPEKTREQRRRNRMEWEQFLIFMRPLIDDLHANGILEATPSDPMDSVPRDQYERAIPILAKWLYSVTDHRTIEWISRSLCVPFAGHALPALIYRFSNMRGESRSLARWTVALAISCSMGPPASADVLEFAVDPAFGPDRFPLVAELRRLRDADKSISTLMYLLDDETIPALVIARAMHNLADPRCRPQFEAYLLSDNSSVRTEARKGLAKLDKLEAKAAARDLPSAKRSAHTKHAQEPPGEWPKGLPHDALVYLIMNDMYEPETLSGRSASNLLAVRGIGPKAIERIQFELERRNLPPLAE